MKIKRPILPQFWDVIVEAVTPHLPGFSPCWVCIGPDYGGYARFKTVTAHRVAAALYICDIPSKVMHRCGNTRCVRREHLSITYMKDRSQKYSKLTGRPLNPPVHKDAKVIERVLADRYKFAKSAVDHIAQANNVSVNTVKMILRESPVYDIIAEAKAAIAAKEAVQYAPHKKEGNLLGGDRARFDEINKNRSNLQCNV